MFNTLFDHIKNHKGWYSLVAVIVLLAVVAMTYGRMPGDLNNKLAGQIKLHKAAPTIGIIQLRPSPYLTHGQFVTKVFIYMQKTQCAEDLCPKMSRHRPEEVARCNLQARGIFSPPMPGYDWYDSLINKAEAIKIIVDAFDLPQITDLHILPYKDLKTKQKPWYFDYVLTGYGNDLIDDTKDHLFNPKNPITEEWLEEVLSRIKPMEECPLHNGEFIMLIYKHMLNNGCANLCPEMSNHRPEEVARCNLQARGIFNPPMPSYDWYTGGINRAEVIKLIVRSFDISISPEQTEPYSDVSDNVWVAAAYSNGLIYYNARHLFHPSGNATESWVRNILSRITDFNCES